MKGTLAKLIYRSKSTDERIASVAELSYMTVSRARRGQKIGRRSASALYRALWGMVPISPEDRTAFAAETGVPQDVLEDHEQASDAPNQTPTELERIESAVTALRDRLGDYETAEFLWLLARTLPTPATSSVTQQDQPEYESLLGEALKQSEAPGAQGLPASGDHKPGERKPVAIDGEEVRDIAPASSSTDPIEADSKSNDSEVSSTDRAQQ